VARLTGPLPKSALKNKEKTIGFLYLDSISTVLVSIYSVVKNETAFTTREYNDREGQQ
jgi:hypothetical protein